MNSVSSWKKHLSQASTQSLIALLAVLAFVLLRKKRANAQAQDSESTDNMDIEQQETQITQTVTSDEMATRDNPLFESQQIADDHDLFDNPNDFEEASL
ncbi:hypothetical protein TVAG_159940 [Trichomonas vaginalis G3]|uniref:Uncharacterized protein n=1 Tax=Trichomonas vaginalis (strain ATCC PRA-98 / G3) TaxID=412133 RepID=A2DUT6_TRIV3|nr:hypothetical protein TVAGG3_0259470 [Trichomonas vaginalis G3]EAY15821.1 hypothetical protein TVAG_159940 [Trichomonas vaginalis G3]KAI5525008.1 hypothetical protein TVAGG3_0259470 [Trichomonas vaginalis G3]|eukprot:XP_001328044.1 hypothetical protein [Trichomonas vaginalis G3]